MKRLSKSVRVVVARALARRKRIAASRVTRPHTFIEALEPRVLLSASPMTTSNFTPLGGEPVIVAGPGGFNGQPQLDLNGDGQADLIVSYENRLRGGSITGYDVAALLSTDAGPMTEVTISHINNPQSLLQVIASDVTNDGRVDVVVYRSDGAVQTHRFIDVYVGQSDGTFTAGQSIDLGTTFGGATLSVFDMTGDGFGDLHLRDGAKVTVYRGDGDGTFGNAVVSNFPSGLVTGIDFTHDMTGDGIADMVISTDNFISQSFGVYRGLATGGYNTASPTFSNTSDKLTLSAVLQLNADTAPDIVTYSTESFVLLGSPATVRVFRNNGTGGMTQTFVSTTLTNGFYSQNIGAVPIKPLLAPDLDGDGDLDIILLEGSGLTSDLTVRVLRNTGNASYVQSAAIPVSDFSSLSDVTAADIDDDGFMDIFVQQQNGTDGGFGTAFFNNGDNTFSNTGVTLEASLQVGSVAPVLVDLNNDGLLDVLMGSVSPGSVEGFINNGGRTFNAPVVTNVLSRNVTLKPEPFDLTGDGLPDVIGYIANGPTANAASFQIFTGLGNGGFEAADPVVVNALDVNNNLLPTVGDLNGDGLSDLVFTGEQASNDNFSGIYTVINGALPPTDTAGTDHTTPRDLGTLLTNTSVIEFVEPAFQADQRDRFDFYKFTLATADTVRFTINPEVTSVYFSVLPENGIGGFGSAFPSEGLPGSLTLNLQAGTYLINVNKGGGAAASRYRLDIEFPDTPAGIGVINGLNAITSGQVGPVDYGSVAVNATDTTNNTKFTVRNTGSTVLNLDSLVLPAGFVLGSDTLTTSLQPGQSDSFTVLLDTSTVGQFSGNIVVGSSDGGAPDFLIPVVGEVVDSVVPQEPEIAVRTGVTNIDDGRTSAISFGTVTIGDATVTRTFTVNNDGQGPLTLGTPQLPAGFTLTEPLDALIAPGESDSFTVSMPTGTIGQFSGEIVITNNDADENPFNFAIAGTVQSETPTPTSALTIRGNNLIIADNDDTPSLADGTDFGQTAQGVAVTHDFTITNDGAGKLTITSVTVPDGFVLKKKAPKSLSAGKSATLTLVYTGSVVGIASGDVVINTNEAGGSPVNYRITGEVLDTDNTQDIATLTKKGTATGFIGAGDASDSFTFTLAARSKVTLSLKAKKTNLDLYLLNNLAEVLGQSANAGTKSEKLTIDLEPGTYTVRVDAIDDVATAWSASVSVKALR